ncbi:MAG: transglycosylase domain-containing protein, partial [Bacteroidota bacterium]
MIPERVTWSWIKGLASQAYRALKRLIKAAPWLSLPLAVVGCALVVLMLIQQAMLWGAWGKLPTIEELRPIGVPSASQVYSIDGKVLGLYYLEERLPVSLEEVSPHLIKALIATEDVRFYEHRGVDWWSMGRAFIKGFLLREEAAGGGSTLTMQLAKNLYPRQNLGWFSLPLNKMREMILAQRLEKVLGKNEILMAYLNAVAFGENAFGIESAARRYFGHSAQQLSPTEAALLVGLLKGTTYYNPRQHPERALGRRNVVLEQMHKDLAFSRWTADSLKRLPLNLNFSQKNHHDGPAPYFLAYLRRQVEALLAHIPHPEGRRWNVYTDGLRLITPIHSRMQAYATEALRSQMKRVQENFDRDWRGIDPHRAFR